MQLKSFLCTLGLPLFMGVAARGQAPQFKLDGHELELPATIAFKKGTAIILPSSNPSLEHIKAYLDARTYISTLRIEGHAANQQLSEERAAAVCTWLVERGVDCKRLLPVGFGSTKPKLDAPYDENSSVSNTRITVVNAALRERPIGGLPLDGGGNPAGNPCE